MPDGVKIISVNKKARFNYQLFDRFEAGMVLRGTEVKALREGRINLTDGFVDIVDGEAFLVDVNISGYTYGNRNNHPPLRRRKLLLHKREIKKILSKVQERGFTVVPVQMFFKNGIAKVEIALAKGKTMSDKREDIKRRDHEREMRRAMKDYK